MDFGLKISAASEDGMSKQGEMDYFKAMGPEGVRHSLDKPFSDDSCGNYLIAMGGIMAVLPKPPARMAASARCTISCFCTRPN